MAFVLNSPAFKHNESIPAIYTCDGNNISPPLLWQHPPEDTRSFALIMQDPDAPRGTWDHWLVFNIPAHYSQLTENFTAPPDGIIIGKNSWAKNTYGGPCPPQGEHRYFFTLYALDTQLPLDRAADKQQLLAAMREHILGQAELMGRYARK